MIFQAHRGVSSENPENTMPSFEAAVRQGYGIAELDVSVTEDTEFVLLHDNTLNRTARYENGELIPDEIKISEITYKEALQYDFGIGFSKKFKGTKIPLLKDVLEYAKNNNIKLKIDNKYQNFTVEQKKAFFEILRPYDDVACLTCSNLDEIKTAKNMFPKMYFHYDGAVNDDILSELGKLFKKEELAIWLPYKNPDTSWVSEGFADKELSDKVKHFASLGLWILSDYSQLEEAKKLGADIIETQGNIKPEMNMGLIADMHTHSESSHDSVCKIEDMYEAQTKRKTEFFAVTDHFDTAAFNDYDIFTPILTSYENVAKLNTRHGNNRILSGVEIGEGFWYPDEYEKVMKLADYDVVIGSVHHVKYKDMANATSRFDFSKMSEETLAEYIDAYFDDMLTMIDTTDFDILAHLTCPLRYINGKYKLNLDISHCESKIEEILRKIIKKGIALEVNTSSFELLNTSMPSDAILKKYYDMGGYLLTLGSDAHISDNASGNFEKAIKEIKNIGFRNIYYYKNRNPHQMTLR